MARRIPTIALLFALVSCGKSFNFRTPGTSPEPSIESQDGVVESQERFHSTNTNRSGGSNTVSASLFEVSCSVDAYPGESGICRAYLVSTSENGQVSKVDVSNQVTWEIDQSGVATISSTDHTIHIVSKGAVTIKAKLIASNDNASISTQALNSSASTSLTVTDKPLVHLPKPACVLNTSYNPLDIGCSLKVGSGTVWDNSYSWAVNSAQIQDRSANWISPVAASGNMCPMVPGADKLIYVSHFDVDTEKKFRFEFLADDLGLFHIWKVTPSPTDPNQIDITEIDSFAKNGSGQSISGYQSKEWTLTAGHYAIAIETVDVYFGATGMVASVKNLADNTVVRRSEQNSPEHSHWCIYRVTSDKYNTSAELISFVKSAATCRECLVGK